LQLHFTNANSMPIFQNMIYQQVTWKKPGKLNF
jgi:hypothetical protein